MTTAELMTWIGKPVTVRMESLQIKCTVTDAKSAYGNTRLKVRPDAGNGEQWIDASRVALDEPEQVGRKFRD